MGATTLSLAEVRADTLSVPAAGDAAAGKVKASEIVDAASLKAADATSQQSKTASSESKTASSVPGHDAKKSQNDAIAQLRAVQDYIQSKYNVPGKAVGAVVETAWEVGATMKLDPLLLLAVMAIESSFNPKAESHMGAQGLMQVMTRIHHKKFEPFGGRKAAWLPDANINVGAQILKDCIARRGSVSGGLTCYVGSPGTNSQYGRKVLAERERLVAALAPLQTKSMMLASAAKPAEQAGKSKGKADKASPAKAEDKMQVAARKSTVDEEAAAIVADNSDSQVAALSEATASLTLRTGSVEM